MSFFNENSRDKIYEEMEGKQPSTKGSVVVKILSIVLLLSLGFASGSIYSTITNNDNTEEAVSSDLPLIDNFTPVSSSSTTTVSPNSFSAVVDKTANSVVEISLYTTQSSMMSSYSYQAETNGSGVIISADGYIITNNHVVEGAEEINVILRNGDEYTAELVGTDSKTDIAIIKIDATDLSYAKIGNSDNALVGDFVMAIGNPLGKLGGTVTYGYISALEREITIEGKNMNLMQVDAAVNPGNSGGGLFNANGELIGIVSAKSTGYDVEGLGFAIPINDISDVINDLLTHGYATNRPFLGVKMSDAAQPSTINPYGNSIFDFFYQQMQYGARIEEVYENSPADEAGIKVGDIIVSVNGNVVSSSSDVSSEISNCEVGDTIEIGLIRDNRTKTVKVTLVEYQGEK